MSIIKKSAKTKNDYYLFCSIRDRISRKRDSTYSVVITYNSFEPRENTLFTKSRAIYIILNKI